MDECKPLPPREFLLISDIIELTLCWGQADIACLVIGCQVTQETRVQKASDDWASSICAASP